MNLATFVTSWTRWQSCCIVAVGAFFLVGSLGCGGCSDGDADTSPARESAAKKDAGSESSADTASAKRRSVFGLPLPPSVLSLEDKGQQVIVKTSMTLDEIAAFFESRLTDYEILRPADQVRAVGLRDFMPHIYAYPRGPRSFIVYSPGAKQKDADEPATAAKTGASAKASAPPKPKPIYKRKKGEPVLDRTSDGQLLAPGARWGEPYTPPPGSPLDQKHLRSNFGRPFGEWTLQ